MAEFGGNDGHVKIYHASSSRLETNSSGVLFNSPLATNGDVTFDSTGAIFFDKSNQSLKFGDNRKAAFGDSQDLQIYHEPQFNNSIIRETGSGNLLLGGDQIDFRNSSLTTVRANFSTAVKLNYNGSTKFETLDSGVNITGNLRVNNAPFSSGIDSNAVTTLIDSDYVLARGGASIEVLQEDSSLSHLQRLSFAPVIADGEVLLQPKISVLDSAGTESLLNINFAGGGGVDSAATIAIVNGVLTNVTFTGDVTFDSANAVMFDKSEQSFKFGNNYKATFGDSGNLDILFDGDGPIIRNNRPSGTGNLKIISGGTTQIRNINDTESMANFFSNGRVEIYHNGSEKIRTLTTGINVTGTVNADSATFTDRIKSRTAAFSMNSEDSNSFATVVIGERNANDGLASLEFRHQANTFSSKIDGGANYFGVWTNKNSVNDYRIIANFGTADETIILKPLGTDRLTVNKYGAVVNGTVTADSATISGLKLPTADGTVNQAILTDGNGNLTFGTVALSSAGGVAGVFNKVAVNSFTGDSSNKNFTLAAAPVGGKNSVVITINGIVQHVNSYSLAGSTITLDSAPQSGDAIEMRTHDDYVANVQLRDYTSYVYTPSTNTTAFSGADANGNTLAYDQGKVQVYLNGAKLVTGSDYTETSGTTLTLDSAIGSGDTLEIVSLSKAAIADFGVLPVDSDLTTTAANQIIHEFNRSDFRTVKYLVQLEHDSDNKYHSEEILLTHNNTTVAMTTYAQILLDSNLGSFDADISGANVRLKLTPTKTNTSVKLRAIRVGA